MATSLTLDASLERDLLSCEAMTMPIECELREVLHRFVA
jgi:hypothetical protein